MSTHLYLKTACFRFIFNEFKKKNCLQNQNISSEMVYFQASLFDQASENYRKTAFRDHSSWIVVTSTSQINYDMDTNNSILDNVVLLNILDEKADTGETLHVCIKIAMYTRFLIMS